MNATLGLVALCAACGDDETEGDNQKQVNAQWEARAKDLESSQSALYTTASPGPWAGKEGTHVPAITAGAQILVETMHGQTVDDSELEDHYITTIYVRDQDGTVVHLIELDGTEEAPTATFDPPAGATELTAYSYCNLHGLWRSEPVAV